MRIVFAVVFALCVFSLNTAHADNIASPPLPPQYSNIVQLPLPSDIPDASDTLSLPATSLAVVAVNITKTQDAHGQTALVQTNAGTPTAPLPPREKKTNLRYTLTKPGGLLAEQKAVAVAPLFFISHDSEDFNTVKVGTSLYPFYEHGDSLTGVRATYNHYSQNGFSENGEQFDVISKNIAPRNGLGYQLDVGVNSQGGNQLLTTDSNYSQALGKTTNGGVFINRDWVETERALKNDVSYTFLGANIEQQLTERLSATAVLGRQIFSDSNNRDHVKARLIYSVLPDYGVNLQLRYRAFFDDDQSINYFNPDNYQEAMLAAGIRRRVEGWILAGTAGFGRQSINHDDYTSTKLVELQATSPYAGKVFFRTNLGYSQSVGLNGPDYSYYFGQGELVYRF